MLKTLAIVNNMEIQQWVLFDYLRSYKTVQILIKCQGGLFFFLRMIKMLGYLFQTQKKDHLDKILLFIGNTVVITGRVKKGNSAEIEQVLVMICWALNQMVVGVKSIWLHRNYSQTLPSETFCSAYGI